MQAAFLLFQALPSPTPLPFCSGLLQSSQLKPYSLRIQLLCEVLELEDDLIGQISVYLTK